MMGASGGRGSVGPQGPPGVDGAVQLVAQTIMTVAQVMANFPAGIDYVGKYARVSDLYTGADEILRCCYSGGSYYWRPQRTDYAASVSTTGGTMTLMPFVTAPQLRLTGTALSNINIVPDATNAWPGGGWDITIAGVLSVFTATISGLIGSSVPILTGATKRIIYTPGGFYTQ